MNQPLYLSTPEFNGAHIPSTPNINPGGEGVTFTSGTASIAISLAASITPIVEYVSIANQTITNVIQISVTTIASNGSIIGKPLYSPVANTVVTGFPNTPLPINSTLLVTFLTSNFKPPYNVTLSIIACFHPELTTTIVSTTPAYSSSQSRIIS